MTLLNAHQGLPLYLMQKNPIQYKPGSGRYLDSIWSTLGVVANMILSNAHQGLPLAWLDL